MTNWMKWAALVAALVVAACGGDGDGDRDGDGGNRNRLGGGGACVAFLHCSDACWEGVEMGGDDEVTACEAACIEKHGLATGNSLTAALFCYALSGCEDDEACVEASCGDELSACGMDARTLMDAAHED